MADNTQQPPEGYLPVANVQVDSVTPRDNGFVIQANGEDSAEYLIDLNLDMPIDQRTRRVVGEILSQSEWRLWRRARQPLKRRVRTRAKSSS